MQIALVAVVLLAGMWFTVLKPKPEDSSSAFKPTPTRAAVKAQPTAPGVKGLTRAVDKAKAASAASDATNAKIQAASGGAGTAAAPAAKPAVSTAKAAKPGTKPAATTKPAVAKKPAADVDPSDRLLAYLGKGKTLVILFAGKGADDKAARRAVHLTAQHDRKHVVSAYVPITEVGQYEAITSDVKVLTAPTVLVIGTDHKATPLTGYLDAAVIRQAVGDARRSAAAAAAAKK